MIEIESKTKRQEESIQKWRIAKGLGTLNLVPRFGKTRIAMLIAERTIAKKPNAKIVAVAHNDIAWKNLVKFMPATVICTTVHKLLLNLEDFQKLDIDLLIVDEIHKFTTGNYLQVLNLKATFKLGLTGDKLAKYPKVMLMDRGFPVIDTITEEEAIEQGWISDFVEYNLPVEIEEHKKDKYALYSSKINELLTNYGPLYKRLNTVFNMQVFDSGLDLLFGLYSGVDVKVKFKKIRIHADVIRNSLAITMGWSHDLDLSVKRNADIEKWFNPGTLHETGKLFGDLTRMRNDLIINSRNKLDAVIDIIKANDVPTMIFSESTQMASDIARVLGDRAIEYHSKVESTYIKNPTTGEFYTHANGNPIKFGATRLKKLAIDGIMDGTFKYICTVKSLNESVDIPILKQIITTGGTTNPSTHLQRVARGKTLDETDSEKITCIINVYIKDFVLKDTLIASRDAGKLRIRQANSVVYWVDTIDEIFAPID